MYNTIILFAILTIINVIMQTVRSIATIKCGKGVASLVNAVTYGLYTVVVVYTADDSISLTAKVLITALANLVGVYVVKLIEEKGRKDKLWKIEMAIPYTKAESVKKLINVPCNYQYLGKWCVFNCYCSTQAETSKMVAIARGCGGKISAYESQTLI